MCSAGVVSLATLSSTPWFELALLTQPWVIWVRSQLCRAGVTSWFTVSAAAAVKSPPCVVHAVAVEARCQVAVASSKSRVSACAS